MAYLLALWTGLRRSELAALQWLDVDLEHGILRLRAETTKSRRADVQVLHPELQRALAGWKKSRPPGDARVISIVPSSRCVVADLKFAGISAVEIVNGEKRYADFHALRKTLGTFMAVEKVDARIRQAVMRHADPRLTEGVYLDERMLPVRQEIERLPALGNDALGGLNIDERHDERAPDFSSPPVSPADDMFLVAGWPDSLDALRELIDLSLLGYPMQHPASIDVGCLEKRAKGVEPSTFTLATCRNVVIYLKTGIQKPFSALW